jgi:hypothetical protein
MTASTASLRSRLADLGTWLILDVGCARMTMRDFLILGPCSILEQQASAGSSPESSSTERGVLSMRGPHT